MFYIFKIIDSLTNDNAEKILNQLKNDFYIFLMFSTDTNYSI